MEAGAQCILVACAAGSTEAAQQIATALVEERLAACVQMMPVESVYRWEGAVQQGPEVLLHIKTTMGRYPAVEALIQRLHSYELPEISATPITAGSEEYLDWVVQSVRGV